MSIVGNEPPGSGSRISLEAVTRDRTRLPDRERRGSASLPAARVWILLPILTLSVFLAASGAESRPGTEHCAATPDPAQAPSAPAPRLHLEGILDNVIQFEELHDKPTDFRMSTTRVTVRASGTLWPHLEYKVGVVGRAHLGSKRVDNVPFLSPRLRDAVIPADPTTGAPGAGTYLESSISGDLYVQEAFATLRASRFYVRAGRQKIQNGTGYAYNPTDLFNRRVPLDPTYEADGFDALTVGWTLSPGAELQFLTAPRGENSYRVRFQSSSNGSDLALQFTSIVRGRVDWERINTQESVRMLNGGAVTVDEFGRNFRWNQVSGEFSRTVRGVRLYSEAGFAFVDPPVDPGTLGADSHNHERLLVGADRTFASKLRVIAEYMRVGDGRAAGRLTNLNDQMASFKGETLSSDKDNAFLEVSRPFSRTLSGAVKVVSSFDHPYVGINPWLYFDPRSNIRLAVSIYGYRGTAESSYSNVGLGAFAELKITF